MKPPLILLFALLILLLAIVLVVAACANRPDPVPVYTVAQVQPRVARAPELWVGWTVWVRGFLDGCPHPVCPGHEPNVSPPLLMDLPQPAAVLPVAWAGADPLSALLRRLPVLGMLVPAPQAPHWGQWPPTRSDSVWRPLVPAHRRPVTRRCCSTPHRRAIAMAPHASAVRMSPATKEKIEVMAHWCCYQPADEGCMRMQRRARAGLAAEAGNANGAPSPMLGSTPAARPCLPPSTNGTRLTLSLAACPQGGGSRSTRNSSAWTNWPPSKCRNAPSQ
jgi:hypothetical protein